MSDETSLGDFSMLDLLRGEVESQVTALKNGLASLAEDEANPQKLEPLIRAAHSIKGAARIVNLPSVAQTAGMIEAGLTEVQNRGRPVDSPVTDSLLEAISFFEEMAQQNEAVMASWIDASSARMNSIESRFQAVRDGTAPGPSAAPAPPVTASSPDTAPPITEDASMLELFRTEVEAQSTSLNEGLLALEIAHDTVEALKVLMRAAHSIKGAARIVGLDSAVKVAHAMEDAFVAAQEGKVLLQAGDIDHLLTGVDFFKKLSQVKESEIAFWLGSQEAFIGDLASQYQAIVSQRLHVSQIPAAQTSSPSGVVELPAQTHAVIPPQTPSEPQPSKSKADGEPADRSVKVTAESLNRILGLAAESLVENQQIRRFSSDLLRLKRQHQQIYSALISLREGLERSQADPALREVCSEVQRRFQASGRELNAHLDQFDDFASRLNHLSDGLYREVLSSRMRPFGEGVEGFPRMVRDLARRLSKKVRFEILGKHTPVDRDVLERLEAPLNHILRNALDHGMEFPNDRIAAGKSPEGHLRLEARHRAGMLLVEVSDDGAGVNQDRVRTKVLEKKLSTPELIERMSENELLEFLFLPGFSTASSVTEISGRGVGLDVVQDMVHQAGGAVRIFSQRGKGTTFQLQLPITRSVIRGLLVRIAGQPYAFPLARIDRALRLPWNALKTVENHHFFPLDGSNVGLVPASDVLEVGGQRRSSAEVCIVVVSDRTNRYGLEVDCFLGERDLVVRPLHPRLGKVPDISSASLMDDGTPLLVVDVDDIVRSVDNLLSKGGLKRSARVVGVEERKKRKRVLIVDDSITVREVERKLLENHGYQVDVAVDGREGWNAVRLAEYDLVISDVDMPRMNGIEFVKQVRRDARLKALPIMIVSYKDREEDRLRGLEAGANYYFTKSSFHDESLINAVRDLIGAAES